MSKRISVVGQQFSRLTVLADAGVDKHGRTRSLVRCICGVEKIVRTRNLTKGNTRSCGCLQREVVSINGKYLAQIRWLNHVKKEKVKSNKPAGRPNTDFSTAAWTRLKDMRLAGTSLRRMASTLVAEGLIDKIGYVTLYNHLPEIDHQLQTEGWIKYQTIKGANMYVTFEKEASE